MTLPSSTARMMVLNNGSWPEGVWGPVTATLDWCEANYQFSRYIAEMANTFSNLFSIGLALHGAINTRTEDLPFRFTIGFLGFTLVGLGSFAFHATMLYEAQLADELPMIFVASYGCFVGFDTESGFGSLSRRGKTLLFLLITFNILFIWSYIIYRNPVYHQVVFASLMLITAIRIHYLLTRSEVSKRIPSEIRSSMGVLFATGLGLFAFGFFVWNLDNIFCPDLTRQKVAIGWPAAFLLEGHAWWHIFTGAGTELMMLGIIYVTLSVKDDHRNYALDYALGLPYIKSVTKIKAQ